MKSLPSRGSDAPHVHLRLRKCRSRCTLDCGFKISESPALRGFVGGLRALATAALYLVLKSNGLHCPKIRLKKFGFSLTTTSANIAKKLPPQRCSKPFFNFSHKRPTFAFTVESGYTLAFANRIPHKGSHAETGAFPSAITVRLCAASEIPFIPPCFYIHTFPGSLWPLTIGRREKVSEDATATLSPTIPHCGFNFSHKRPTFAFTGKNEYTLGFAQRIAHKGLHAETGVFRTGVVSLPSDYFTRFGNPAWPGFKTAYFAAFGSWSETLLKNAESLRDSDALMHVAVPKASRPRWAA